MKYVYRFQDEQGGTVEVSQPMADDNLTEYEGRPVKRVYSATGVSWAGYPPAMEDFWASGDPADVSGKGK